MFILNTAGVLRKFQSPDMSWLVALTRPCPSRHKVIVTKKPLLGGILLRDPAVGFAERDTFFRYQIIRSAGGVHAVIHLDIFFAK